MIRVLYAISKASFSEAIRQPVHLIITLLTLVMIALSPRLALFGMRAQGSLLADFGVSMLLLSGLVQTCFAASGIVRREIETRTTLMLFAKPVSRELFLIGKYIGVLVVVLVSVAIYAIALQFAVRQGPPTSVHHPTDWPVVLLGTSAVSVALLLAIVRYVRTGRPASSVFHWIALLGLVFAWVVAAFFDRDWGAQEFGEGFDPLLARASLLSFFALSVLVAFALSASVLFGRGGTFISTIALYLIGLGAAMDTSWLFPLTDFRMFWLGDLFYSGASSEPPLSHLAGLGAYASLQVSAYLAVGCLLLRRKGL